MRRVIVLVGIAGVLAVAGPVAAEPEPAGLDPTTLTLEADEVARTGEPHEVVVALTGQDGDPLVGQTITVVERIHFFDYADTALVGEARTDHRGIATLSYLPGVPGPGQLTAQYPGSETLAGASDTLQITVDEGIAVDSPFLTAAPDPLLPRGVTAAWFLPLLLAVWLAIAWAVYDALRIPMEREVHHET